MNRLNKYGFCLTSQMKYAILDDIGNHFMDHAVELVKKGHKFVYVMDNIDWTIKVHEMQSDNQNKDVHAVATSLVFDRVPKKEFSSKAPQQSLANVNVREIVTPTAEEMACTRERYKIVLGNIICEHLQHFKSFKDLVGTTPSLYPDEMQSPSVIIPYPVMMKDEKKYAELVDVLDTMETWIQELHCKAGITNNTSVPVVIPGPAVGTTSRPDQPGSHIPRDLPPDDPLPKVPCYGDQLSRVRLAGGKDLRAGCHTPKDRLDHLYPFRIADWHTKQSLTKVSIKNNLVQTPPPPSSNVLWYFTIHAKHFTLRENDYLIVSTKAPSLLNPLPLP